jgi:hypothetical protein
MMPSPNIEYRSLPHIFENRNVPTGKRLIILAEAEEGTFYEPIQTYRLSIAEKHFRSGALIDCYKDASIYDENLDIYLMRVEANNFRLAFEYLKPFTFDLVYLHGLRAESEEDLDAFIELAREKEQKGHLIHGIVDLQLFNEISEIETTVAYIRSLTHETVFDIEESGKYLSFVVDQFKEKAGAVYAGVVTSLKPEESPINKTLAVELEHEFSKEMIHALKDIGIVCFRDSYKKGVVCASASCAVSTPGSVHKHISNFRIVQYVLYDITLGLQDYIGNTMSPFHIANISTVISDILNDYKRNIVIRDYEFTIMTDQEEGTIYVDIELVPAFSTQRVTAHSQIRVFK